MCTPLQGRQADLDRSLDDHADNAILPIIGRNKPVILRPIGDAIVLAASCPTRRREAASLAVDRKATATSLADGVRPGDVNEADERRSPRDSVRQQDNRRHHGLGDAAADGGAYVDNVFPDDCRSRADSGEHRQASHENAVVADSKGAKMHLNEEKENRTVDTSVINNSAQAARSLEPIPAGAMKVPFAEDGEGAGGGRGGGPPSSPGTGFRSRIGDGLRNLLTLGSEAQITPASCSPLSPGDKPVPGQQQQTKARGLSPLSWSRRTLLRNEKDATGKVLSASLVDGPDGRVDDGSKKDARRRLDGGLDSSGDLPARGIGGRGGGNGGGGGGGGANCGDANGGEEKVRVEEGQVGGEEATATDSTGGRHDSGRAERSETGLREGEGIDSKAVEDTRGVDRVAASGNGGVATGAKAESDTDGSVTPADANDAAAGAARGHAPRGLARDNTLVARDQWPSPLDDEANPDGWALDKSEADVLAAARRMGSVLVRVVTWNLHAKPTPPVEKLREALLPPGKFHIYAIGTEECLNSIAKSVIVHSKKEWESTVKEILGSSYEMLCGHALQATHNAVFAHRGIVPLLRNVRSLAVATGLSLGAPGAKLGNKGGVGISFDLGATSCIFVNSHLAAHQTNVRERNDHFFQISSELVRELGPEPTAPCGPLLKGEPLAVTSSSMPLGDSSPSPVAATTGGGRGGGGGDENLPVSETAGVLPDITQRMRTPSQVVASSPNETGNPSQEPSTEAETKTKGDLTNFECESKESETAGTTPPLSPYPVAAQQQQQQQQPECPPSPSGRGSSIGHPLRRAGGERMNGGSDSINTQGRAKGGRGGDHSKGNNSNSNISKTLPEVFDRVIWAGDLNYRVDVPRGAADLLLSKDMHGVLLQNEQLSIERGRGGPLAPFTGYREGPLNFRPTYKFDSGSDTYDTSSKRRVPAWTDRVLFASAAPQTGRGKDKEEKEGQQRQEEQKQGEQEGGEQKGGEQEGALVADRLHLRAYRSVPDLRTSDHRPVIASFVLEFDQRGDGDITGSGGAAVTNQTSSEICVVM